MPFSWGKSSPKDAKKPKSKGSFLNGVQSWLRTSGQKRASSTVDDKNAISSRTFDGNLESPSETSNKWKSQSKSVTGSASVSRSPSFAEQLSNGRALPLPYFSQTESKTNARSKPDQISLGDGPLQSVNSSPLPSPSQVRPKLEALELEGGILSYPSCSVSSGSSLSIEDMTDLWPGNGITQVCSIATCEGFSVLQAHTNTSMLERRIDTKHNKRRSAADMLVPNSPFKGAKVASSSPKVVSGVALGEASPRLYVTAGALASSMSNSSFSSPTRSPRTGSLEQFQPLLGVPKSAQFQYEQNVPGKQVSNLGSCYRSGLNVVGGDRACPNYWQHDCTSPGYSSAPSPRNQHFGYTVASSLPNRVAAFSASDLAMSWHEDKKRSRHPLPLPPAFHHTSSPFASSSAPSSPSSVTLYNSPPVRWQKGKLLGSGTFGNVYKGFSDSGTFCAMKEVLISEDPKSKESVNQLAQEIHFLSRLRHPNIVQYFGSETLEDRLYIYLEYVSGGSIHRLLHEYGQFKEPVIRCYTRQILSGLTYLHSMNTVHRDIKGANILVDTNGEVKLADFGMAKHINAQSIPLSFKGSPYWMAPEVFKNNNGYNYPVDIWSLGCTVIEMASAKPPWSQYEGVAAMFKIGNSKEIPTIPPHLSKDGQSFLRQCLQRKPSDRPTAAQLLEHPFVKNTMHTCIPEELACQMDAVVASTPGVEVMGVEEREISPKALEISRGPPNQRSRMHISSLREHSSSMQSRMGSSATSPTVSPSLQARGMYYTYGGFSASPKFTPFISSGSSTSLVGFCGASPSTVSGLCRAGSDYGIGKPNHRVQRSSTFVNGFNSKYEFAHNRPEAQPHELQFQTKYRSPQKDILAMALGQVQPVLE